MNIIFGQCKDCQREARIIEETGKCGICARLDAHDAMLDKVYTILSDTALALDAVKRLMRER